jgi:hypothetical protein
MEDRVTMTKEQLEDGVARARRHPHGDVHRGELIIAPDAFRTPGMETNLIVSPYALLDCTGSIHIGAWCNISARCRVYTHDHVHQGRRPLFAVEKDYGVMWQDKYIGTDVWLHDGSIVLYQATYLPDGFVLGAGSVLTKNPGTYEIWAGAPARRVGRREERTERRLLELVERSGYRLPEELRRSTGKDAPKTAKI